MTQSTYKPARSSSRVKSAQRGKNELFNSTTPLKFVSNFDETIRDNQGRPGQKQIRPAKADKARDTESSIVITAKVKKASIGKQSAQNPAFFTVHPGGESTLERTDKNITQTLLSVAQSENNVKLTGIKRQLNEIIRHQDKGSQSPSKIRLRLHNLKNRSQSSLSNERKNFNQNINPNADTQKLQTTITASLKDKINI